MIGTLINIVFQLVILGILWWAVQRIIGVLPISEPFLTLINVVAVVVAVFVVIYIIQTLLAAGGVNVSWPRL